MQGDRQAAAVWLGDEVDGGWCGGGVEPAGVELHTGTMESVLVEGGSLGIPCRCLSNDQSGFTSNLGRTQTIELSAARLEEALPRWRSTWAATIGSSMARNLGSRAPLSTRISPQRASLLQGPGVHRGDERVSGDEVHLKRENTEEEVAVRIATRHGSTPKAERRADDVWVIKSM